VSGHGLTLLYRGLTRLWPEPFPTEFAPAAVDTFDMRLGRARSRASLGAWWRIVRELVAAVWLALRWRLPDRPLDRQPIRVSDPGTPPYAVPPSPSRRVEPSRARHAPPGATMDSLLQDLRSGFRSLRRSPGFATTVILTLALGIGANTAIFSVVDAVLLGSLPFAEADRIVRVGGVKEGLGDNLPVSAADFVDFREQSGSFSAMTLYTTNARFSLTGGDRPEEVRGLAVADGFFEVFGIAHVEGRGFRPEEQAPGEDDVVVLGHGVWERRFGADPDVVGGEILLSGIPHTIVGVARPGWEKLGRELFVPLGFTAEQWANRRSHFLQAYGRLAPDVTLEEARVELAGIAARLEEAYPETNTGQGVNVTPLRERMVGPVGAALWLLQGAVAFVLLIACANVAGLMLARARTRSREMAIRSALGAGRLRVARQLLTESVMLAAAGGMAGTALAAWGVRLLTSLIPPGFDVAAFSEIGIDLRVLVFAAGATLLTGVLFGLVPAVKVSRTRPGTVLRTGEQRTTSGRSRTGAGLVVTQVALGFVLLVGAGLLVRSFDRVLEVDLGFEPRNVLTLQITRPSSDDPDIDRIRARLWTRLVDGVGDVADVEAAAVAQVLPLQSNWTNSFAIEGGPVWEQGQGPEVEWRSLSPAYFDTLGIPLLRGRTFGPEDAFDGRPVAIVDRTLAERFFPDEDPVGRRLRINPWSNDGPWLEIVGVAGAVRHGGVGSEPRITVYRPVAQAPQRTMQLAVRTRGEPRQALAAVQRQVWDMDPDQPVARVTTLGEALGQSVWVWRFSSTVLGLFAGLALLLAAAGIHGVLAHAVELRTREIGVRMSLGASRGRVLWLVVGRGMLLAGVGAALGAVGAAVLRRLLGSLLYGVGPFDPVTWGTILVVLLATSFLAAWMPARRAGGVDPLSALRAE